MKFKPLFLTCVFISTALSGTFSSEVFQYDDTTHAKGLHYTLKGQNKFGEPWEAHEVKELDIPFHQALFSDPEVMKLFANGQLRSPSSTEDRLRNQWMYRSQVGQPHSGMTVFIKGTAKGHVVPGGGDDPGASEMAYSFLPETWGKGLATSVVNGIVTQWAPAVRRLGLGTDLDESEAAIKKAFTCFGDQVLSRLDATASPENIGSLQVLLKNNFEAANSKLLSEVPIMDLRDLGVKPEETSQEIIKFFDIKGAYQEKTRYRLIDQTNLEKTFSVRTDTIKTEDSTQNIKVVKYHFEHGVE